MASRNLIRNSRVLVPRSVDVKKFKVNVYERGDTATDLRDCIKRTRKEAKSQTPKTYHCPIIDLDDKTGRIRDTRYTGSNDIFLTMAPEPEEYPGLRLGIQGRILSGENDVHPWAQDEPWNLGKLPFELSADDQAYVDELVRKAAMDHADALLKFQRWDRLKYDIIPRLKGLTIDEADSLLESLGW